LGLAMRRHSLPPPFFDKVRNFRFYISYNMNNFEFIRWGALPERLGTMLERINKYLAVANPLGPILLVIGLLPTLAVAYVEDMRITELVPHNSQVEVTNVDGGTFMNSTELPFYYSSLGNPFYYHSVPPGWILPTNQGVVFSQLVNFSTSATDFWLYRDDRFDEPSAIIHGLQFGTPLSPNKTLVCR
jgi:hypothetical protein